MVPDITREPLVSVIVCVYNARPYLRESLLTVLKQDYENLEVLIVDDGSNDGSMEAIDDLLADPRIRVFTQENRGKPSALNLGIEQARGEFYAVHDADDLSEPSRIRRQVECMLANPDVAAVYCGHSLVLGGKPVAPLAHAKDRARCHRDICSFVMPAHDPTGMYRLSMVGQMRYEPDLPIVEGFDYVLRVGERFPMLVVEGCLYGYRIHASSVTRRNPDRRQGLTIEVLRRACQRRGLDFQFLWENDFNAQPKPSQADDDNNLAAHFIESVCDLRHRGRRLSAIRTGLQCSQLGPLHLHYQKALLYSLAPMALLRKVRERSRQRRSSSLSAVMAPA